MIIKIWNNDNFSFFYTFNIIWGIAFTSEEFFLNNIWSYFKKKDDNDFIDM